MYKSIQTTTTASAPSSTSWLPLAVSLGEHTRIVSISASGSRRTFSDPKLWGHNPSIYGEREKERGNNTDKWSTIIVRCVVNIRK